MPRISDFEILQQVDQPVLSIQGKVGVNELSQFIGECFMKIDTYLKALGGLMVDVPFVSFSDYENMDGESDIDVTVGFPVSREYPNKEDIKYSVIPERKAIFCMYRGDYNQLSSVYAEISEWFKSNGYESSGNCYEYYYNGQNYAEEDMLTKVIVPLKTKTEKEAVKYYIVDAFAEELFSGNQAGVCLLNEWPEESVMQDIASENNLAETAFVVKTGNTYELRWFTPEMEINLCGHATLATAFVITNFVDKRAEVLTFNTKSGELIVTKDGDLYQMDFPAWTLDKTDITLPMIKALGTDIQEAYLSRDLLLVVDSEEEVRSLKPDMDVMKSIPQGLGVIVTARGSGEADFVSRFFVPKAGIPEDPVTGSSHSSLIPFWAERLGKDKMLAFQLSKRGGTLYCENKGDRVSISGYAKLYLEGSIKI